MINDDIVEMYQTNGKHLTWFGWVVYLNGSTSVELSQNAAKHSIQNMQSIDEDVRNAIINGETEFALFSSTMSSKDLQEIVNSADATDIIGQFFRERFAGARIISQYLSGLQNGESFSLVCLLVFPRSSRYPKYVRVDHAIPVDLAGATHSCDYGKISKDSDIRAVFSGHGFQRVGMIASGSPGWDMTIVDRSRNCGTLSAVWNDFQALVSLLRLFDREARLSGVTVAGVVQNRSAVLGALREIVKPAEAQDFRAIDGLNANVLKDVVLGLDSPLNNALLTGASITDSTIGRSPTEEEYLVPPHIEARSRGGHPYVLFSYAGHGTRFGELAVERGASVAPKDIFEISYQAGIPFVIIVDMCYSHFFGEQYGELMDRRGFPGVVICATSNRNENDPKAYEHEFMKVVRRPQGLFRVTSTAQPSRGVFSSALVWSLLHLRDLDYQEPGGIPISFDQVLGRIVTPACASLANSAGLPIQSPTAF
jgi:hypothetical protein